MATDLFRELQVAVPNLLRVAGIILVAFVLTRILKLFTRRLVRPATSDSRVDRMREQQTRTLSGVLQSAGTVIILSIAFLMVLPIFGFAVTPIAALVGLASLAVGFGAQNLVRDVISGFFIVFEDQFFVGDTVRIGDMTGRVEHVTLRRTVLRDARGALVTIPNGEMRQVANLSRDWSQMFLDVEVEGEQPLDAAFKALEQACTEFRNDAAWSSMLVDGPRVLGVEALTLTGATLRVQVRTAPNRNDDVARELRRRIQAGLLDRGIALAGTHRVRLASETREAESFRSSS